MTRNLLGRFAVQYAHLDGNVRTLERCATLREAQKRREFYRRTTSIGELRLPCFVTDVENPESGDLSMEEDE